MSDNNFRVLLPNLRYKKNKVLFEFTNTFFGLNNIMIDTYDNIKNGSFKVFVNGDLYDTDDDNIKHTNVYNIEYELEKIENNRGIICNIRYPEGSLIYGDDFKRIAKMTEMHITELYGVKNFDMNLLSKYLTK